MTILYEKYRPKTLEEFCGHETIILELKKWLANYFLPKTKNDASKANVIIMGTSSIFFECALVCNVIFIACEASFVLFTYYITFMVAFA